MNDDLLLGGIFESRGQPAGEESVRSFEEATSIELPAEYRAFVLAGDGARFRQYNEIEGTYQGGLREIFALDNRDTTDRSLGHVMKVYSDRVPSDFLPVGDDSAGNLICLRVAGDQTGEVLFWDHETEAEEGDSPTMENMEFLAHSLLGLFELVKIIEMGAESSQ